MLSHAHLVLNNKVIPCDKKNLPKFLICTLKVVFMVAQLLLRCLFSQPVYVEIFKYLLHVYGLGLRIYDSMLNVSHKPKEEEKKRETKC